MLNDGSDDDSNVKLPNQASFVTKSQFTSFTGMRKNRH